MLKKTLSVLALIAFAALFSTSLQAGCGSCGGGPGHSHEVKKECTSCPEKACSDECKAKKAEACVDCPGKDCEKCAKKKADCEDEGEQQASSSNSGGCSSGSCSKAAQA